ncbi:hypothetical protein D9M69_445820 [compost metagenome]
MGRTPLEEFPPPMPLLLEGAIPAPLAPPTRARTASPPTTLAAIEAASLVVATAPRALPANPEIETPVREEASQVATPSIMAATIPSPA